MTQDLDSSQEGEAPLLDLPKVDAPRTLSERLRISLAEEIIAGRLPPGSALDETELANRFQVSRTPVREALRQLSALGLITHRAHRGAVVIDVSADDLKHMFEVLNELEVLCAGFAAERMTPEQRRQFEAMHVAGAPLVQAGQEDEYARYNEQFHALIHGGSQNPFLIETVRAAKTRVAPFRRIQFHAPGRLAKSYAEHQELVDTIQRGDAAAARALMRQHLVNSMNSYRDFQGDRKDE